MKEPLNQKLLRFLVPLQKAPVQGFVVRKSGPITPNLQENKIKLKGSHYHLTLPWGAGVAVKEFGLWSWVQPELPAHIKSQQSDFEFEIPAWTEVKIAYRGTVWILELTRDFDRVDLAPYWKEFRVETSRTFFWISLAFSVHALLYVVALYVPIKPISWLQDAVSGKSPVPTFSEQVIEEAKKNQVSEDNVVKVKFAFFNGVPWMDKKQVKEEKVQRLDNLLKGLKGLDAAIAYDDKGAKNAQDALAQRGKVDAGQKKGLIAQVFSNSKTSVVPKLSNLKSTNRDLTQEELKIIRQTFQSLVPEMTLAYQRALTQDSHLAFGLKYETTINANGHLGQVKFNTSGSVNNSRALQPLLNEIRGIFEKTMVSTKLSGVTVQGENIFRNE